MVIVLLDDDFLVHQTVKLVTQGAYQILAAKTVEEALALLEGNEVDGALIDLQLKSGPQGGIDFLRHFKSRYPDKPAVMLSGRNDAETIVECMKVGADDFIEKSFDREDLLLRLKKVFSDNRQTRVLRRALEVTQSQHQIVGDCEALQRARALVERAGKMRILFCGETGVGKTPFAWYSNQIVAREEGAARPFEQMNCAGLQREHFQDQMFGHKKGAFTGAIADKKGLVEIAKGGDLFLDEIGEMPLDTQALFLTFLDTQEFYRLGDDQKRRADVRILCATNRDLKKMVAEGSFRKDLYSRIAQVVVAIPPLRERGTDIVPLLEHFIQKFCGFKKSYTPEVVQILEAQRWEEGNVREFRDAVEFMCTMGRHAEVLDADHLSDQFRPAKMVASALPESMAADWISTVESHGLEGCLDAVERSILAHYYENSSGVVDSMVRTLRVSKPTLYRRLRRFSIPANELNA